MSQLTVVAKAKARPGMEKELEKILLESVEKTHLESGCVFYAVHRSVQEPGVFLTYERWLSKQDMENHLSSIHIKQLFEKLPPLVAAPPELNVLETIPSGKKEKWQIS